MQNIQKLYQDLHEGKISKNQFLFQIRKDSRINSFFTSANSYDETVRILKNRGLLFEVKINESIEENSSEAASISKLTNTRQEAVQKFIDNNKLNGKAILKDVTDGGLVERVRFIKALSGTPGNPAYNWYVKNYSDESSLDEEIGSNDPETSHEGLDNINEAKNNPKVEKLVNVINDMISKAVDSDGDPIGVLEPGTTWEEPYTYSPIEYKNGTLTITSKSQYKNTPEVDKISSENMMYDGIPTLQLIARMYKKALKKSSAQEPSQEDGMNEATHTDAPGAWVAYLSMPQGKKLLKTFDTARGAKQYLTKNANRLLAVDNVQSVGIMTKKEWDEREAKYAVEPINEDATPKNKIVAQWMGPDFYLSKKLERTWDEKDYDLFNRLSDLVQNTGQLPDVGQFKNEKELNEAAKIVLVNPDTNKFIKTVEFSGPNKDSDEEVKKLNSKLTTAQKDKGLYWKVSTINEAKEPTKGADQVNPYELEKGTYYELDCQKEGAKDTDKAKAKALKNLNKNPKYYSDLFSKKYNDKPNTSDQMQIVKESLKNLIDDILSEK